MGFNRRKMEDQRRQVAEKEAAQRRATDAQVLEDAERLIGAWNDRQAKRMPMLFSPTIGAAVTTGYWFLWVRCPACRTTNAIDLRTLDRHRDAAVTSLIPALSCRSCRPNAPFAELVRLSRTSIADEMRIEHTRAASWRVIDSPRRRETAGRHCGREGTRTLSRVSFLMIFVRDHLRRSWPRVQIAKAAITGEYVTQMVARLECGVLAVPVHGACPDVYYCAPRGIATRSAG
jgi:hypothetical protein